MLDKALDQSSRSQSELVIYDNIIDKEQEMYYQDLVSLFHALQNDKFTLVYQPKIDIQTNELTGVEALIRWNDSNHNNMSISELIKRAEDAEFINQITKWVIRNVAEQLKIWKEEGLDISVSINLSSRDLSDETFIDYVDEYITKNEIDPDCIEFELTERSIILNEDLTSEELKKLKSIGIKLSLDDYGTGYNSLKYLLGFVGVFDYLKIDKIFIDNILKDESFIIVECIIKFAHGLGMKIIAEGVETIEQSELLKNMGCDIIQGYYYSKPLSPDELEQFMNV
jgi:EAL domain-containing protein (putative c-di-GMP-specific phosphodiesterase class I)